MLLAQNWIFFTAPATSTKLDDDSRLAEAFLHVELVAICDWDILLQFAYSFNYAFHRHTVTTPDDEWAIGGKGIPECNYVTSSTEP